MLEELESKPVEEDRNDRCRHCQRQEDCSVVPVVKQSMSTSQPS